MTERVPLTLRKRDESMRRVLREAQHLMERKGYYNTTVRELCERCLISKTTFFNYFGSKDGIVFMIVDECAEELCECLASPPASLAPPVERIELAYRFLLDSLNRYSNIGGVFYQLVSEHPEKRAALTRFTDILRPLIVAAQETGAIRADVSPDALNLLIEGMHFTAFYHENAEKRIALFSDLFGACMQLLRP